MRAPVHQHRGHGVAVEVAAQPFGGDDDAPPSAEAERQRPVVRQPHRGLTVRAPREPQRGQVLPPEPGAAPDTAGADDEQAAGGGPEQGETQRAAGLFDRGRRAVLQRVPATGDRREQRAERAVGGQEQQHHARDGGERHPERGQHPAQDQQHRVTAPQVARPQPPRHPPARRHRAGEQGQGDDHRFRAFRRRPLRRTSTSSSDADCAKCSSTASGSPEESRMVRSARAAASSRLSAGW